MDESDISKWDNNIERWMSSDYDILNETVEGKPYSDDELREKFRNGLKMLERKGDFDALMFYNDNCVNSAEVTIVIWKALAQMDIHSENLTGRQLVNLHEILKEEIRR